MTLNPQSASDSAPNSAPAIATQSACASTSLKVPAAAPRIWALLPCAGSGSRAQTRLPKQYQNVAGQPMVLHTLDAFARVAGIASTLVVVAPQDSFFDGFLAGSMAEFRPLDATVKIANYGGITRAASVFNGLNCMMDLGAGVNDWVLVHDAARCLITPAQIQALIDACLPDGVGGLLAHALPDTLKSEAQGRVAGTINRNDKWLAQTPQMFRIGPLLDALKAAAEAGLEVTDESSAMEAFGLKPKLVPGSALNFKVTYPEDFVLAEAVLGARVRATVRAKVCDKAATRGGQSGATSDVASYDYP